MYRNFTLLLLILMAPGISVAQGGQRVVKLRNGATFEGRALLENQSFLDLELERGVIRLYRSWMVAEEPVATAGMDAAVAIEQPKSTPLAGDEAPATPHFPVHLEEGASRITPLLSALRDMERRTAPEALAVYLLEMMAQGRGDEVVPVYVDGAAVLARAFPHRFRALTAYSRRLTVRNFGRLLLTASDPTSLSHVLKDARVTGRLLPQIEDMDIVELTIQRQGFPPILGHMGIRGGRVVDLTLGPPPFQEILRGLQAILESPNLGGMSLHDAIESAVLSDTRRVRTPPERPDAPSLHETWVLVPQTRPYTVELPYAWRRADDRETPRDLDFLVFLGDGRLGAAGISEKGVLGLDDLKELFLYQGNRNELISESDEVVATPYRIGGDDGTVGVPGILLKFQGAAGSTSLSYQVLLFFHEGSIHQVAAFCKAEDLLDLEPAFQSFFRGIKPGTMKR